MDRVPNLPEMGGVPGKLLSLAGDWIACRIEYWDGPLSVESLSVKAFEAGMSGSPILDEQGRAIGLVSVGDEETGGGPNPRLTAHLPGWDAGRGRLDSEH
jgi:hypothetical protein